MDNNQITNETLMVVAGDVERLLLESRKVIEDAFCKANAADGLKISFGITLDRAGDGAVVATYEMAFPLEPKPEPPERHKVKSRRLIDGPQGAFEYEGRDENGNDLPSEAAQRAFS